MLTVMEEDRVTPRTRPRDSRPTGEAAPEAAPGAEFVERPTPTSTAAGGVAQAPGPKPGGTRPPGRPKGSGSFPAEKAEMVIALIRSGSTRLRDACSSADLPYSTVRGWITRAGADPDCPKRIRAFVRRLTQASSDS